MPTPPTPHIATAIIHETTDESRTLREAFQRHLTTRIGKDKSRRYFNGESGVELSLRKEAVRIAAPSRFLAERLRRAFASDIAWAAERTLGKPPTALAFDVIDDAANQQVANTSEPGARKTIANNVAPQRNGAAGSTTNPQTKQWIETAASRAMRLDNFVVGDCNRLAHAATVRFANFSADPGVHTLVLFGGCGLGKTHLLRGMASNIRSTQPGKRVVCMTGEGFMNRFVASLRAKTPAAFRREVRQVDLLCVDDAQQLVGKPATLQEFVYTLDAVTSAGGRVAVVFDRNPSAIDTLPADLRSRLVAGLTAELAPPDAGLRSRLANVLAARRGLELSLETVAALERTPFPSVRELQGVMARLEAIHSLETSGAAGEPIGLLTLRKALNPSGALAAAAPRKPPSPHALLRCVCEALVVDVEDVLSGARHQRVVITRALTAYLLRKLTTLSYPEIAKALRRPNHSSIITAVRRVEKQIADGAICNAGPRLGDLSVEVLASRLYEQASAIAPMRSPI